VAVKGLARKKSDGARVEPMAQSSPPADSLTESAVRQWLRERHGVAFCCACLAAQTGQASNRAIIAAALTVLSRRRGYLPGRCACGAVGVRRSPIG
jgi:hypothetical protein